MKMFQSFLAIATLAVFATACGDDKGSTTTTDKDTAATGDVGTSGDATPTTDTGAKADTGTAGDTGTTTDTGTTDVGTSSDASPTAAAGGCTGATDQAFRKGLADDSAKGDAFRADVKNCTLTKGCLAKSTDSEKIKCISDCIETIHKAEGLTDSCSACYGLTGWCGAGPCLSKCAVDAGSQGCKDCLATNCDPAAGACIAGTCDPYADNHCKP